MPNVQPSLFTRPDTILGVCEGLGEDLRVNAQYLRAGLAVTLFWNPLVALSAYAVAGVAVLLSRWLFPNPVSAAAMLELETVEPAPHRAENDEQPVEFAAAA